jgi:hypothetical protein
MGGLGDRLHIEDHGDIEDILNIRDIKDSGEIEHTGIMRPMYT